jgi:hypothetical protein
MAGRRRKEVAVSASEARQTFLRLVEDVATDAVDYVAIRHRDYPGRVFLVGEKRIQALQDRIGVLEGRLRGQQDAGFTLVGSGTLHDDPDEFLAAARSEQRRLFAAKLQAL